MLISWTMRRKSRWSCLCTTFDFISLNALFDFLTHFVNKPYNLCNKCSFHCNKTCYLTFCGCEYLIMFVSVLCYIVAQRHLTSNQVRVMCCLILLSLLWTLKLNTTLPAIFFLSSLTLHLLYKLQTSLQFNICRCGGLNCMNVCLTSPCYLVAIRLEI